MDAAYGGAIALSDDLRPALRGIERADSITRLEEEPDFELVCPPSLSICCFRYRPPGSEDDAYLDRLNDRLMTELQVDGRVFPSNASVHGRAAIRTCIVGYRTETDHLERLLALARELGGRLHAEGVVR